MSGILATAEGQIGQLRLGTVPSAAPPPQTTTALLGSVNSRLSRILLGAGAVAAVIPTAPALNLTSELGSADAAPGYLMPGATTAIAGEIRLSAAFDLTFGMIEVAQSLELTAAFLVDAGLLDMLQQGHLLGATFVLRFGDAIPYIGPGSGLVIDGITREQLIAMLREGDTFQAILPWAGVRGRSGLTRVLDRMRDDTGRPTFRGQFIPTTDPSLMQSQVQRPRLTVDTRTNLVRRVRDAEQQVNKLESTTD